MRESGEPMECRIFDFYKVFSRDFGEEENGVGGTLNGSRKWISHRIILVRHFHIYRPRTPTDLENPILS